jgi:hypothetical protein
MVSVYGEGASSVCRPTAVSEAVSAVSAGVDSLRLDSRPKERTSECHKSETGILFVAVQVLLLNNHVFPSNYSVTQ